MLDGTVFLRRDQKTHQRFDSSAEKHTELEKSQEWASNNIVLLLGGSIAEHCIVLNSLLNCLTATQNRKVIRARETFTLNR